MSTDDHDDARERELAFARLLRSREPAELEVPEDATDEEVRDASRRALAAMLRRMG